MNEKNVLSVHRSLRKRDGTGGIQEMVLATESKSKSKSTAPFLIVNFSAIEAARFSKE